MVAPLGEFTQLVGDRLKVSCNTNPSGFGVQEIVAVPGRAATIVCVGAPGVWTAAGKAQKPPVTEYCPLVIAAPASGWPMVPLTE